MIRIPTPGVQALAEAYDSYYGGTVGAEASPSSVALQLVTLADSMGYARRTVLDFGCGTGEVGEVFRAAGSRVTGVENHPQFRELAGRRLEQAVSDVAQLRGRRFSLILLVEVIEHLARPLPDLVSLRGLLDPDGVLLVTTPNARGLRARLLGRRWQEARNPTHLTLFSRAGLTMLLNEAGFCAQHLPPTLAYEHHTPKRAALQRLLGRFDLQGGLLVAARALTSTGSVTR